MGESLLELRGVTKHFGVRRDFLGRPRATVRAVEDVSLSVPTGHTLGIVGESGCGKTTLSRIILGALAPTRGSITLEGREITGAARDTLRWFRSKVQVVFQDPYTSLSPRLTVADIIMEPMQVEGRLGRTEMRARVGELLTTVGLDPSVAARYPHEFSGGQRQRVAIARAFSTDARLIVMDEPVSALDASIRAHVINLMRDLQDELGVSYVFIGHDLAVVANVSDEIAVMYLGRVVEQGTALQVATDPRHPYSRALFAAALPSAPGASEAEVPVGEVPSALAPPPGCHFHPRCPLASEVCHSSAPPLRRGEDGRKTACHHVA